MNQQQDRPLSGDAGRRVDVEYDERIDRYVDGELTDDERLAFERECAADPSVASMLDRVRGIDAAVSRVAASENAAPAPLVFERERNGLGRLVKLAGVASIAAALVIAAIVVTQPAPRRTGEVVREFSAASLYTHSTRRFEPSVVCDTPEKFRAYTRDAYGRAIDADFAAGVTLVGWSYPFSPYARGEIDPASYDHPRVLLAESAGGERVIAVFDEDGDWNPGDVGADVRVFTGEVGGVTVTEISALDEPVVLGLLSAVR